MQTPSGTSRYKVLETSKICDDIAEVTIAAGDWLDPGTYAATYEVGEKHAAGSFAVYGCRSSGEQMRFVGTFTRDGASWESRI